MGGGDLNSKKSWHPNTIKNQERVWKAEQAAAEEKKRILELQRERAEEKDRAELNDLARRTAGSSGDDRLNWMYDKPDKKAHDEDYLLGKSIEKNYGQTEKEEHGVIPAVARRVVGSSMVTSSEDSQVDLARKIREDPLLLVKERERAARAALLNNPLQRRRLTELLRKEQEQKKEKKKSKNKGNLDDKLAAKLSALGGEKTIDIAKLLDSGDSSSDSDEVIKSKKKKKKNKKEERTKKKVKKSKKKSNYHSDTEESSDDEKKGKRSLDTHKEQKLKEQRYRQKSESTRHRKETEALNNVSGGSKSSYAGERHGEMSHPRDRRTNSDEERHRRKRSPSDNRRRPDGEKRKKGLSEVEKAAKLAEMASAGVEREHERGRRVAAQRARPEPPEARGARPAEARALPDSLESRIHSNRHYIQRGRQHMNEHFARR